MGVCLIFFIIGSFFAYRRLKQRVQPKLLDEENNSQAKMAIDTERDLLEENERIMSKNLQIEKNKIDVDYDVK